ncbi:MAG: helix-turn-helix domain-containing protein [Terriglobales bacterium]
MRAATVLREATAALGAEPGLTSAEVAYRCGFSSGSAFARFLRRQTGMAPGEYRARLPSPPANRQAGIDREFASQAGRRRRMAAGIWAGSSLR